MQKTLFQTADAEVSHLESGCRSLSIRQRMQETLYQPADAGALYQTADAGDNLSNSGCRISLSDSG